MVGTSLEQRRLVPTADPPSLRVRGGAATLLVSACGLYMLRLAGPVIVPLLVALLLSYALEPLISLLGLCRLPRLVAAIVIYAALAIGIIALGRTTATQVASFLDDVPRMGSEIAASIRERRTGEPSTISRLQHAASELQQAAVPESPAPAAVTRVAVVQPTFDLRVFLVHAGVSAVTTGVDLFVIALLSFLLVATGDLYKRKLVRLGGTLDEKKNTLEVLRSIERQIERYLVARLLISAVVAAMTAAGLLAMGLAHALVWGVLAGALNVLPFVGSGVAIALTAVAAALQFHSPAMAALAGGITLLVAVIEANAITPWLTSRAGELNTIAVFVGVLFWGWVWSFWGMVLAVPIMVAVKAAADRIEPLKGVGELLGE